MSCRPSRAHSGSLHAAVDSGTAAGQAPRPARAQPVPPATSRSRRASARGRAAPIASHAAIAGSRSPAARARSRGAPRRRSIQDGVVQPGRPLQVSPGDEGAGQEAGQVAAPGDGGAAGLRHEVPQLAEPGVPLAPSDVGRAPELHALQESGPVRGGELPPRFLAGQQPGPRVFAPQVPGEGPVPGVEGRPRTRGRPLELQSLRRRVEEPARALGQGDGVQKPTVLPAVHHAPHSGLMGQG